LGLEAGKKIRAGGEFTFKELELTGSIGYENRTERETFHESMKHEEIYRLFVTWYGSIGGHKSTKSLSGKSSID
jgi:hypothetical protein